MTLAEDHERSLPKRPYTSKRHNLFELKLITFMVFVTSSHIVVLEISFVDISIDKVIFPFSVHLQKYTIISLLNTIIIELNIFVFSIDSNFKNTICVL